MRFLFVLFPAKHAHLEEAGCQAFTINCSLMIQARESIKKIRLLYKRIKGSAPALMFLKQ